MGGGGTEQEGPYSPHLTKFTQTEGNPDPPKARGAGSLRCDVSHGFLWDFSACAPHRPRGGRGSAAGTSCRWPRSTRTGRRRKVMAHPSRAACLDVLQPKKRKRSLQNGVSGTLCKGTLIWETLISLRSTIRRPADDSPAAGAGTAAGSPGKSDYCATSRGRLKQTPCEMPRASWRGSGLGGCCEPGPRPPDL